MLRRSETLSPPPGVRLDKTDERLLDAVATGMPWRALLHDLGCPPAEAEGRLMRLFYLGLIEGTLGESKPGRGALTSDFVEARDESFEEQPTQQYIPSLRPEARRAEPAPARQPSSRPSLPLPSLTPEDEAKLRAVDELIARLNTSSHYELLGVAEGAAAEQIRRAYFALSKRFHPDRYFRKPIGAYGAKLSRVFAAMTDAYETLRSPAKRAAYDQALKSRPPR